MAEIRRYTRSMSRVPVAVAAEAAVASSTTRSAAGASVLPSAAASTAINSGPATRSRLVKQADTLCSQPGKRQRATDVNSTSKQQNQPQTIQEQQDQQPPKKPRVSVRQLAYTVRENPNDPHAVQHLYPLLDALVKADVLSDKHWKYSAAVFKIADEAPMPLLQALLNRQHVLQRILQTTHQLQCKYVAQNAALTVVALLRAAAGHGVAAHAALLEPLLDALLAEQQKGLLQILQGMRSTNHVVRALMSAAMSLLAQAVHTAAGPQAASLFIDGMLAHQQCGLTTVLEGLHEGYSAGALQQGHSWMETAADTLRCLALAAPQKMLQALLSQQQRRGLQHALRALDSQESTVVSNVRVACDVLIRSASAPQLQQLLVLLLRALQQGSFGAGHLLLSAAQLPHGPVQLKKHIKALVQLAPVQNECQPLAAATLWTVAHNSNEAVEALAACDPTPMLRAMLLGGGSATLTAGTVCLMALSDSGKRTLSSHVPGILEAAQLQQTDVIASMAMRTIGVLSTAEGPAQDAVLRHINGVLDVLLHQRHADTATAAGSIVLNFLQQREGLRALCQVQHLDKLLRVVQQRGPGIMHAARAIAQLATSAPESREWLAAPERVSVLNGLQEVLHGLLLADTEFLEEPSQAYFSMAPVYWCTVAATLCQIVPAYVPQLVQVLQRPELTIPAFEALTHLTGFRQGLLALAPHIDAVHSAVTTEELRREQGLQSYAKKIVAQVKAAVRQLQQEQARVEGQLYYSALQLATLQAKHMRRRRAKLLQVAVLVWVKNIDRLSRKNEELLQQLQTAGVV